ncbi:MAG: protein kinase domain-containing protein [Kofleriaceae bacterium]
MTNTGKGSLGVPLTATRLSQWDVESKPGTDLQPGTRIKQYELIRELGRGGMGVVYVARDLVLGRRVAMKFLRNVDREIIDRFLVEARSTAQANHDNIVIIYEVDEWQNMPYMVLEYIEGKTLRDFMGPFGEGEPIPSSRVVELMLPVARGLARAHELGIVHRDLKPENIMVTTAGQVKVLDFGIAKALDAAADGKSTNTNLAAVARNLTTLTNEGALVGTLPYMSPEQLGQSTVDHRSDLFALGMMMFEMLAGHHPVEPLASDTLVQNLISPEPMRSLRTAVSDLPDGMIETVDFLLRKRKDERLGSAAELAQRLEELLPGRHGRTLAEGESPYPGLTAFQEADADRFFGRTRDVARMVSRVRELPLTGIVGPSGVGKSSFVRAGVGPALKGSGERWEVVTIRPGKYPLSSLASVLERTTVRTGVSNVSDDEHGKMIYRLRREPGLLGATLRARAAKNSNHILLFVDQFEELYTLVGDAEERNAFTGALAAVADDAAAPLRVVVSMRSDFLDRVSEDPRFMEELSRGLVFLSAPDREGLREALELPVEMVGYRYESPSMVDDMLEALAGTPGALPLLQFAAAKLWDARDRQQRLLTLSSYEAIGGISGALATHADEVVRNMSSAAQKLTQQVFRQLVTPERTRAIVELADLFNLTGERDEIQRVIDQLVAARLLVVQTRADAGGGSVEIVHESLIDRWPALRRWLDEGQEDASFVAQLAATAKQWATRGKPAGLLWRGDAAEEARRWYMLKKRELGPREEAFIDAVLALGRRGKRMRRVVLIAAFVVLGGIAAGASVMLLSVRQAREEADRNAEKAQQSEAKVKQQLADVQAAKEAMEKANAEREKATQLATSTGAALAMSKEELAAKNAELEKTLEEAKDARTKAESATRDAVAAQKAAQAAAAEAQKAKAELQVKLDAEKLRVKQLQEETKKLSTKLKE